MTLALKQSTASQEIPLGYFLDSTDGDTEETGLTIANTDIKIHKAGATTLANKNSGGGTHISNGIYYAVLDATDTDTVGPMVIFVHVAGALSVRLECHVYEEVIYDALFGASAAGFDASGNVTLAAITHTGSVIPTVSTLTGHTAQTADHTAGIADIPTVAEFNARTIAAASYFDPAVDAVANVTLVDTTTTNTDMVSAAPTAIAIADQVWDEAKSGHVGAGSFGEEVQAHSLSSELSTHDGKLDTVDTNVDTINTNVSALNDISVADILTTQMTEAYAADGTAPTLAQALFLIQQSIGDFSISGTTITAKQLDGSTTAATYTLDDATDPTSRTRAT